MEVHLKPVERDIAKAEQKTPKFDNKLKELAKQEKVQNEKHKKIHAQSNEKLEKVFTFDSMTFQFFDY